MTLHFNFKAKTKLIFLTLTLLAFTISGNAQFLKKIKKKVATAVENKVIQKTSDKAANETSKKMDDIFNSTMKKSDVDPSSLPDSYDFEWRYSLKMTTKGKDFEIDYFLKPEAKYYGSIPDVPGSPTAGDMFMVMDAELGVHIIFMDMEGGKMAQMMDLNLEELVDAEDSEDLSDYTFTEIGTKVILGYNCQGFRMENKEIEMTMYVTNEAPVSFTQVFGQNSKTLPKGFDPKWLEQMDNGCMMEMDFKNKKKNKHSAKMTCVAMEKEVRSVKISDYQIMGSFMPVTDK